MTAYLSGETDQSPRREFWYVNDDGQIVAARYDDWKVVFLENRGEAFGVWREPFVELRVPLLFNLRRDPFEKAQHNSNTYNDWFLDRAFVIVPIQALAARFLQTMLEYPPSQSPGSFNLSKIEEQLTPTIDQLADDGFKLLNFAPETQCTPSRSALMTGRYSIRSGNHTVALAGSTGGLVAWERTLAEVLSDAGYATSIVRKLRHDDLFLSGAQCFSRRKRFSSSGILGIFLFRLYGLCEAPSSLDVPSEARAVGAVPGISAPHRGPAEGRMQRKPIWLIPVSTIWAWRAAGR
jgi:hypothetical protein